MSGSNVYAGLEPAELWRHFAALNGIPRPSGHEAAALAYVRSVAESAGAGRQQDGAGNLCVRVPASPGGETAPAVAIQAHLDMVCEQRPGVGHEFLRDPIRPRLEGDWLYATGTTLGADNGIGAAAALALLTDRSVAHGPLELLFTVEEETGLVGAQALDPALLTARYLVNLDSEDPGTLTVGCAGGGGVSLVLSPAWERAPEGWMPLELSARGLKGGHSGVQIHQRLANAVKLLAGTLEAASAAGFAYRVAAMHGGNAHNAIPRDATAVIVVPAHEVGRLEEWVRGRAVSLGAEWAADEPGLALALSSAGAAEVVLAPAAQAAVLRLLNGIPHGVLTWSAAFPGKVETSCNLALAQVSPASTSVTCSVRSFVTDELRRVQSEISTLGEAAGARVEVRDGYPGWAPDPHSHLLAATREAFRSVMDAEPEVEVIHAGLECGVLAAKRPGLEAISFGPRIEGAHTPEERVRVSTVADTWRLLVELLRRLAS